MVNVRVKWCNLMFVFSMGQFLETSLKGKWGKQKGMEGVLI